MAPKYGCLGYVRLAALFTGHDKVKVTSADGEVIGIADLKREHEARISRGMQAYADLVRLKSGDRSPEAFARDPYVDDGRRRLHAIWPRMTSHFESS